METTVKDNIEEVDNKDNLKSIEEIALEYLKNKEAKIAMKMDHSILNRLK